ncbi:MAG: hypothetical protein Ct9H300mP28_09790 [Pseudomonadota bacterium]|nr:MAG: hypothetical protein Ct9H300mP28_09790 [Pseudomonadota bacterium]
MAGPAFPLLGFILNGMLGKRFGTRFVSIVGPLAIGLAFAQSVVLFFQMLNADGNVLYEHLYTWIKSGNFEAGINFQVAQTLRTLPVGYNRCRFSDTYLFFGLYERRGGLLPFLRLPEFICVFHADSCTRRRLFADVRRLGRSRIMFLSFNRLLL